MYALAVNGSPRKGGNTELLLKAVLAELEDAEGMANMRHLGKAIDWLGKAIAPHKTSYPEQ